jgi:hypothetical protein
MSRSLYQYIALRPDVPEHGLRRGDVALVVDHVPHPAGGAPGYVLEVFNAVGESIAVLALAASDVAPLRSDEVLAVRPLLRTG